MQFGQRKSTTILDDNGSSETVHENYVAGEVMKPRKVEYAFRKRVKSQDEEHKLYLEFSQTVAADRSILDPSFRIEYPKLKPDAGYYDVVTCYTRFENS